MPVNTFQIMYEPSFYSGFLASLFHARFGGCDRFLGALVLADPPGPDDVECARALHARLNGLHALDADGIDAVRDMYGDLSELALQMVRACGFPALPGIGMPEARFIGASLSNLDEAVIDSLASRAPRHIVFTFINQIFRGKWIDANIRLVNAHPGVLPFARGVGALEQIAASGDRQWFANAAGATIHYIDASIDAGPIIRTERFVDPFSFDSLSHLRAVNFDAAFRLMADLAGALISYPDSLPAGVRSIEARRYPVFRRADRTPELAERAARNFLRMKQGEI